MQLTAFSNRTAVVKRLVPFRVNRAAPSQSWFLTKTFRVMRLTSFFLIAFCLHLSAKNTFADN